MRREDVLETYYLVKEAGRIPLSARPGKSAILDMSGNFFTPKAAVGRPLVGSALKNKELTKEVAKKIRARGGKTALGMPR
tara:strand:+ start:1570 stop:1809 length:240 start_codon:yes stop_codon:yes gene_type:complete